MWACAFRATFISSISFIYLLYLSPYSPLFTFIQQTLPLFTQFEGGGTESFSETCCPKPCAFITHATRQSHAQQTPQRAREDELGGLHTHTHVYLLGFPLRDGEDSEIRRDLKRQSDSQSSQRSRLCLPLPTCALPPMLPPATRIPCARPCAANVCAKPRQRRVTDVMARVHSDDDSETSPPCSCN